MNDLTPQGAAAVRLATSVVSLRAERDRARDIAVAFEQRLARIEALADEWEQDSLGTDQYCAAEIRVALEGL